MANEFITRSGLRPNDEELPFVITTSDVEKYLQTKVDTILETMHRDGKRRDLNHIDVRVYTTEAGSRFVPFIVVLPLDVLEGNKRASNSEPSIFNPKSDDRTATMINEFYHLFAGYIFNRDDEKCLFSDEHWRRERGVSRQTSDMLKSMRRPKVSTLGPRDNRVQAVMFLIDPIRIFHDMLIISSRSSEFRINITGWKKIKNGEFDYVVKRTENDGKHGKKKKVEWADELNRKMRGGH